MVYLEIAGFAGMFVLFWCILNLLADGKWHL
jgi:hypothetical protein